MKSSINRGIPTPKAEPKGTSQKVINNGNPSARPGTRSGPVTESSAPKDSYHIRGPVPGAMK